MNDIKKIYIVTAGEYSDYHIERVFLDETKARNFAKYSKANYISVEEYELDDDNYELVSAGYWGVTTRISARKKRGPRPFFTENQPYTQASLEEKKKENDISFLLDCDANAGRYGYKDSLTIWVTRYFPESMEEEKAKDQTEKIAYDIFAEINNRIVDGEDVEEVIDLMREKYGLQTKR